jgi:hypothetical protein
MNHDGVAGVCGHQRNSDLACLGEELPEQWAVESLQRHVRGRHLRVLGGVERGKRPHPTDLLGTEFVELVAVVRTPEGFPAQLAHDPLSLGVLLHRPRRQAEQRRGFVVPRVGASALVPGGLAGRGFAQFQLHTESQRLLAYGAAGAAGETRVRRRCLRVKKATDLLLPGSGRCLLLDNGLVNSRFLNGLNCGRGLFPWCGLLGRCRLEQGSGAGKRRRNVKERRLHQRGSAADVQEQSGHMLAVELHGAGAIAPFKAQSADAVPERGLGAVGGAPVALDLAF